jgi:NADP-dependent 3-hydroxy acid dehydrogenase YdfG
MTIAIVGAGPGLGLSLARRFGREGHRVELLARNRERLDAHVALLDGEGIEARAHVADVLDRAALGATLAAIESERGIDVLAYNPTPSGEDLRGPEETTVESAQLQMDYSLFGAIAAAQAVLPGMLQRGGGALLFTGGYSAVHPVPSHASAGLALSAQRNYAYVLNRGLADRGVYAGTVTVAGLILGSATGDGIEAGPAEVREMLAPLMVDPGDIADVYWDMMTKRDRVEEIIGNPALVESVM